MEIDINSDKDAVLELIEENKQLKRLVSLLKCKHESVHWEVEFSSGIYSAHYRCETCGEKVMPDKFVLLEDITNSVKQTLVL